MKSRFTVILMAMTILSLSGVAFAQLDEGDTVYCQKVSVPSPPWPDSIPVKVFVGTDNYLAAYQLGFRPMINGSAASASDVQITSSNSSTSILNSVPGTFFTPTLVYAEGNSILVGWTTFNPFGVPLAPRGELTTLYLKIVNPNLPVGTKITIDTVFVPPTGYPEINVPFAQGQSRPVIAPYDPKGGDHVRLPVQEYESPVLPQTYSLDQNQPNPFNPTTTINFALPRAAKTKIEIYNILGQKVITLVDEYLAAGSKRVEWNGKDDGGNDVASGVYLYRMTANDYTETKKMMLMK